MFAQKKLHIDIDYNYNLGVSERLLHKSYNRSDYKIGGNYIGMGARLDLSSQVSLGANIVYSKYTELDFNTMPIYAMVHISPLKSLPKGYAFANIGFSVKVGDDFYSGPSGKIGIGYSIPVSHNFSINLKIGYDFQQFRNIKTISYNEGAQKMMSSIPKVRVIPFSLV
ncbi:MAG: hypothetical protein SPM31_08465 [Prevotella sp.]|nr:hypothetical protein [Prevotella sp.]